MPIGAVHLILAAVLVTGVGTGAVAVSHAMGASTACSSSDSKATESVHPLDDTNTTENETDNGTELAETNDSGTGLDESNCEASGGTEDSNSTISVRMN